MTGDSSREQSLWNLRGQKASNGKTAIFEALKHIAPGLVVKMENNIFETTYGSRHKEIAMWKGARIGYINELSKNKQDKDVLKEVSDGNGLRFKVMFGTMNDMPISFKCFIIGNNTINVSMDEGMKRRLKMMQMDSDFIDGIEDDWENCRFNKNKSFVQDLQTKYKHALLALSFQYSKKYVDDGLNLCEYPKDWVEATEDVARENNKFDEFFYNHFEIDPVGEVSKKTIELQMDPFKKEKVNLKDEFKRMRITCTYDPHRRSRGERLQGVWTGFKIIQINNTDIDDNDEDSTVVCI